MEVKEQYHIHIRKRMAALINLDDIGNFRSVSESVNEDIQILVNIGVKKKRSSLKQNVQNWCVTFSAAIPLRQNCCQGDGYVPWCDRYKHLFRDPPSPAAGRVERSSCQGG